MDRFSQADRRSSAKGRCVPAAPVLVLLAVTCWGTSAAEAAHTAVILEELAQTAWLTLTLNPSAHPVSSALLDKHFLRKHGPAASYGQKNP